MFALISAAKENDDLLEGNALVEDDRAEDQPEEEKIKQEARQELIDELRYMTYEEIVDLIEKGY